MRITQNTLYALGQLVAVRLSNIVTFILVTHYAGVAAAGAFSLAITYLLILTSWWVGLDELVVREVAQQQSANTPARHQLAWQTMRRYSWLRMVTTTLLYLGVLGVIWLTDWYAAPTRWFITILLASSIGDGFVGAVQAGLVGQEQFMRTLLLAGLQALLRLVLASGAVLVSANMLWVAWGWLLATLISALMAWLMLRPIAASARAAAGQVVAPASILTTKLRESWPFWVMGIVVTLEYQLDVIFLSAHHPTSEVGFYSLATTLFSLATLPLQAFRVAIFPVMARAAAARARPQATQPAQQENELSLLYAYSLYWILALALPCGFLGYMFAAPAIQLVFGSAMTPASLPTQWLMLAVVFFALNVPQSRLLLATNQQRKATLFIIISATVNVLANLWLGSRYGAIGAAVARCGSTAIFFVLAFATVAHSIQLPSWKIGLGPGLGLAAMVGFLALPLHWPWWLLASAAGLLYLLVLALMQVVTRQLGFATEYATP